MTAAWHLPNGLQLGSDSTVSSVPLALMAHNSHAPHNRPPVRSYSEELSFARRVVLDEANALRSLAEGLDEYLGVALDLLERCVDAHGTVLVTGLGKSGLIGQKIAATLASLGVASHFVHPAEAAHGDLGRFRAADAVIAISNSGETEEVVNLASILRQDGIPIIAITKGGAGDEALDADAGDGRRTLERPSDGHAKVSSLERLASVTLHLRFGREAGSPDFSAPTSSTTSTLALGDALALALARRREFTDADFAKRHPGGALGGMLRSVMDVLRFRVNAGGNADRPNASRAHSDVTGASGGTGNTCGGAGAGEGGGASGRDNVAFELPLVPESASVAQALEIAGRAGRRPGAILLIDASSRLSGILTDGDLRRLILRPTGQRELQEPIARVMTRNPRTLRDDALVKDAVLLFRESRQDEIPIVDAGGRPVGLLDVQDLMAMRLVR